MLAYVEATWGPAAKAVMLNKTVVGTRTLCPALEAGCTVQSIFS